MRPQIPVPSKGQSLRATWGAQVADRLNGLCAMAPAGALHREGFGGIGDQALPKNLRDRPAANPGQPMPFDLAGAVETSQDGTQKRLVVKWYYGGGLASPVSASVWWNYWSLTPPTSGSPAPTVDAAGWITVYTGEWMAAGSFSDSASIELWYELQVIPSWQGTPSFQVRGSWYVQESSDSDYSDCELNPLGVSQDVVSYIVLGKVSATSGGTRVFQAFHGDLHLNDLLTLGGGGGGGGEDATNGTTYPMPFQYKRTDTEDNQGNITSSYSIVNCRFYWDGAYQTLADYTPPATGTVWLIAAKSGSGAGSWSFRLSAVQGSAAQGEQSVKLYDFASSRIAMDYRTTTLMFGPGPRNFFEVSKSDNTISVSLDATGTSAKATILGAQHDVIIDAASAKNDDVKLRECNYYDGSSSTPAKVDVLASKAMTLGAPPDLNVVTGVSFEIKDNKLVATLSKTNIRTGVAVSPDPTVDVCSVYELSVVLNTNYTSPDFTQTKRSVTVIGTQPSGTDPSTTVFTTTPLSGS